MRAFNPTLPPAASEDSAWGVVENGLIHERLQVVEVDRDLRAR
jgi:hypothetical protein